MKKYLVLAAGVLICVLLAFLYYSNKNVSTKALDKVDVENFSSPEIEQFSIEVYYLNTGNSVFVRNSDSSITNNEKIGFRSNFPKEMKFVTENNGVTRFPQDFRQDLYVVDVEDEKGYFFSHPVKTRAVSASEVIELLPYIHAKDRCTSRDNALLSYVRDTGYFPDLENLSNEEIVEKSCKQNPDYNNLVIRDGLTNIPDGDYYLRFMIYDNEKLVATGASEEFSIQTE